MKNTFSVRNIDTFRFLNANAAERKKNKNFELHGSPVSEEFRRTKEEIGVMTMGVCHYLL